MAQKTPNQRKVKMRGRDRLQDWHISLERGRGSRSDPTRTYIQMTSFPVRVHFSMGHLGVKCYRGNEHWKSSGHSTPILHPLETLF
jgi:hypothetical protein